MAMMHRDQAPQRKSAWIPWVFVGAMGVVVAVNATLITYSVTTFSGLSVEKPYERGVHYNQVLDAQAKQDALGWTLDAAFAATDGERQGRLVVVARDRDGGALDGLALEGRMVRPLEVIDDVPVHFEAAGDGRYVARVELPRPGQWDLKARATRGGDAFTLIERLDIR